MTGLREGRIFITGTGRAGTTFLVTLCTSLGLDTGFGTALPPGQYATAARAGLELDPFDLNGPRIVKNPALCDRLDAVLAAGIKVAHIVVPVRDFGEAARSRLYVQRMVTGSIDGRPVHGGLRDTKVGAQQRQVLESKFATLVESAVRNDIPLTFLSFPRLAQDADYLYEKLAFMLGDISRERFREVYTAEVRPQLIHDFSGQSS